MEIKSYHSLKTEIKKSNHEGKGLFSSQFIKKDEIVAIKNGHIFGTEELRKIGGFNSNIGKTTLQIADNFFVGALKKEEVESTMLFINHSCSPNLGKMGNIITVAMHDIEAGEELTSDYAMHISYPEFNMECMCETFKCRRKITGEHWKNKDLQKKYGKYFSSYLREKF